MFDPVIGRFVSADPFEDCGLLTQGRNRFAYVGNRAVTLKDPTGFWSEPWDSWGGSLTMQTDFGGFSAWDELQEVVVTGTREPLRKL